MGLYRYGRADPLSTAFRLRNLAFVSLGPRLRAVILVQLVAQGPDADPQDFGGLGSITFAMIQRRKDMSFLNFRQGWRGRIGRGLGRVR